MKCIRRVLDYQSAIFMAAMYTKILKMHKYIGTQNALADDRPDM